jgi:hypothetical protein
MKSYVRKLEYPSLSVRLGTNRELIFMGNDPNFTFGKKYKVCDGAVAVSDGDSFDCNISYDNENKAKQVSLKDFGDPSDFRELKIKEILDK